MTTKSDKVNIKYKVDESIGFLTGVTYRAINRRLMNNFRKAGHKITTEQFGVLAQLWKQEGLTQQEISCKTAKDKPSITRLLNNLESKKLIVRKIDKDDKRCNKIYLTGKGKGLKKPSMELASNTLSEALDDVDEGKLDICKNVLRKIRCNLEELENE